MLLIVGCKLRYETGGSSTVDDISSVVHISRVRCATRTLVDGECSYATRTLGDFLGARLGS